MYARRLAAVAGLITVGNSAVAAQEGTSCPIPINRQIASVSKFAPIASFLTREPRCVNCHGAVNPHISGTGPDPADADAPPSTTAHGGGLIARQRNRAPDGTLLIETECMDCHNAMVPRRDGSKSVWMIAPGFLSFVGKDATSLCKQIKRATHNAPDFLGHLKDDNGGNNFSGTAFRGDRGLDPEVYEIPRAPPSISHAAFMRLGQDWVDAMGGSFQGDESCGCEVRLEGKFTYKDSLTEQTFTKVTANLVWTPEKDDQRSAPSFNDVESIFFRPSEGEITIEENFLNWGIGGPGKCTGTGRRTFSVDQLTPGALRYMLLEIAADGRYKVTLVIPDNPDSFPGWEFDSACEFPNITAHQTVPVHHIAVVLGRQQGVMEDQGIIGRLPAPIHRGPRTITGDWTFNSPTR